MQHSVEPDGGSVASLLLVGGLWRAEYVFELLLELGDGPVGV